MLKAFIMSLKVNILTHSVLMEECEKRESFRLSFGVPLPDKIAYEILNTFCKGQSLYGYFERKGFCHVKNFSMPRFRRIQ